MSVKENFGSVKDISHIFRFNLTIKVLRYVSCAACHAPIVWRLKINDLHGQYFCTSIIFIILFWLAIRIPELYN